MTAGKGVQHSEMFPLLDTDNRNPLLLFQIWLNLPRRSKKVDPFYRMLWHEDIPVYSDTQVRVKIIAGSFGGKSALPPPPASWASNSDNHVGIHLITLAAGGKVELPRVGPGVNRSLYYYAGDEIRVNQKDVAAGSRIDLDGTTMTALQAHGEGARILVLQGRPVGEPVVQHGPFVVNEREELHEVYRDFQQSQFGGWPWKDRGQVHEPSRGRFARHADGTIESRD